MIDSQSASPQSISSRGSEFQRAYGRRLTWIFVIAIVARAALILLAEVRPALFDFPDSHRYARVALHIAEGAGPIDGDQMRSGTDPLYPLILSIAPYFGGEDTISIFRWGRLVNALASLASILLLADLTRRLISSKAALVATFIFAVDPILLFFNALVLTESLYIFLLLAAFQMLTLALRISFDDFERSGEPANGDDGRGKSLRNASPISWALGAGICLGLGTLTRSTNLFLPFVLAPVFVLVARRTKTPRAFALSGALLFAAFFTLSPVLIRNYRLFGAFVPTRIGGGASLLEALGPWADGAPGMDRILYPATPPGANELECDAVYRRSAFDWARENPSRAMRLALTKASRTWSIEMNASDYSRPTYRIICWLTVAPEFLLAILGVWVLRRRCALLAFLLTPALYFTLIHMIFVGSVRYRLPAMPFLFAIGATAIATLISSRSAARAT